MTEDETRQRALALLAKKDCSRAVLVRRLSAMGADAAVIDAVLEQLASWGYLDDGKLALRLVRRQAGKGLGPRRIRHDLRQAGLDEQIPREALDECLAEDDSPYPPEPDAAAGDGWERRARDVWRRRFGDQPPRDDRERARRIRLMLARGFTWEQIRACIPDRADDHPPGSDD